MSLCALPTKGTKIVNLAKEVVVDVAVEMWESRELGRWSREDVVVADQSRGECA